MEYIKMLSAYVENIYFLILPRILAFLSSLNVLSHCSVFHIDKL